MTLLIVLDKYLWYHPDLASMHALHSTSIQCGIVCKSHPYAREKIITPYLQNYKVNALGCHTERLHDKYSTQTEHPQHTSA